MRTIKFRAWCEGKHENIEFGNPCMVYDVTIQNGKFAAVVGGWDIQGTYKTVPIMQFTGLQDKHGKDIYEGDILKVKNIYNEEQIFSGLLTVYYNEELGAFRLLSEDGTWGSYMLVDYTERYEVIGNIHENKHLIK